MYGLHLQKKLNQVQLFSAIANRPCTLSLLKKHIIEKLNIDASYEAVLSTNYVHVYW